MRPVITFLLSLHCLFAAAQVGPGYLVLKEERKLGVSTEKASKILDALVSECEKDIRKKELSPRKTLQVIGANIFRSHYTFEDNHSTYADALVSKKFDCDQFAITYLTIARKLDLPVYAVPIPQHMVVAWDDGNGKFLWETTANSEKDSSVYIKDFNISKESIAEGVRLSKVDGKSEDVIVNNYVGEYLVHARKYAQSKPYFEKVLAVLPNFSASGNNLGIAFRREGDARRAKELFMTCVKDDPLDYLALNNLGLAYFDLKQFDSALLAYDRSIAVNDKFGVSHYNRGLTLCQGLKRYDDALDEFDTTIKLGVSNDSELAECYMNKGVCYIYKKKYNEAIEVLSEARKLDQYNSNVLVNIAIAQYSLGQRGAACNNIREAIKMGNQAAAGYKGRICL